MCLIGSAVLAPVVASANLLNAMQVTAVTPHPTHQYFVTASMDKTWAFFDADTASCLVQVLNQTRACCLMIHCSGAAGCNPQVQFSTAVHIGPGLIALPLPLL